MNIEPSPLVCPAWCEETGVHDTHRRYLASVKAGVRGSGLVGVNMAQRVRPGSGVRVELTFTTALASAGTLIVDTPAAEIGHALIAAAQRARKANTDALHAHAADSARHHSPPSPS